MFSSQAWKDKLVLYAADTNENSSISEMFCQNEHMFLLHYCPHQFLGVFTLEICFLKITDSRKLLPLKD